MTNNEFFELSESEVQVINGSKTEEHYESWRAGYLFACEKIKNEAWDSEDFYEIVERIVYSKLDTFREINLKEYCKHDWYGINQCYSKCRKCGIIEE